MKKYKKNIVTVLHILTFITVILSILYFLTGFYNDISVILKIELFISNYVSPNIMLFLYVIAAIFSTVSLVIIELTKNKDIFTKIVFVFSLVYLSVFVHLSLLILGHI